MPGRLEAFTALGIAVASLLGHAGPCLAGDDDYDDSFEVNLPVPVDLNGQWTDNGLKVKITMDGNNVSAVYLPKPDGSKVGCKPTIGDPDLIPYEDDFHGTLSDDGKTITGEINYCRYVDPHNNPTGERGGVKQALAKIKISPDSQWLEGCYKTPYGKGKNAFLLTADYSKVEIRLRLFIPSPAVALSTPDFANGLVGPNSVPMLLVHGDGRFESYSEGTNRAFQSVTVKVDPSRASPLIGKKRAWFGETRQYTPAQGRPVYPTLVPVPGHPFIADQYWWWWTFLPGEENKPVYTTRLQRTDDNNALAVARSDGGVTVTSKIDAGIPLQGAFSYAPHINSDITVRIRQDAGHPAEYMASGTHDPFPAYELYINAFPEHSSTPMQLNSSPWSLISWKDILSPDNYKILLASGLILPPVTVGNTPGNWVPVKGDYGGSVVPDGPAKMAAFGALDICAQVPDPPPLPPPAQSPSSQGSDQGR